RLTGLELDAVEDHDAFTRDLGAWATVLRRLVACRPSFVGASILQIHDRVAVRVLRGRATVGLGIGAPCSGFIDARVVPIQHAIAICVWRTAVFLSVFARHTRLGNTRILVVEKAVPVRVGTRGATVFGGVGAGYTWNRYTCVHL